MRPGALALVIVLCLLTLGAAPAARRPNVLVILTDDQGYGDFSAHGNPTLKTPNLDRLHDQSVRLTDFHVSPMCTPTRGQLITGRDALDNGAMNVSSGRAMIRPGIATLPELFAAAGCRTAMFGKWHLGDVLPYRPSDRGFQTALWFPSSHMSSAPDYWKNDYFDPHLRLNDDPAERHDGYCTDVFFAEAMKWMRQQARNDEPFFCYLPTNAPHAPLWVPAKYREPYKDLPDKLARFYGMIANVDENVGKMLAFLDDTHLADNTIVIFMTDNGGTVGVEHFNAGMRGGKVTLWEGGHRVPCFIRAPQWLRFGRPRDVDGLAEVQDWLPTFAEVCGLRRPANLAGVSLAPALRGEGPLPDRMLVVQFSRINKSRPIKGEAAVLWRRWRTRGPELYDLATDPHQDHDVAADHPDVLGRMNAHYERWWQAVAPRVNEFSPITIGDDRQPEVMLSPADWMDVFLDQQLQVRTVADNRNGAWLVNVARAGKYRFELRRYPREADLPITAGLPEEKVTDGVLPPAKALPVAQARITYNGGQLSADVSPFAKAVSFDIDLPAGLNTVKTSFADAAAHELCGAYYVYARRD